MSLNPTVVPVDSQGQMTVKSPTNQAVITSAQYAAAFIGGMLVHKGAITSADLSQFVAQIPADIGVIVAAAALCKGAWNTVRNIYKQIQAAKLPPERVTTSSGTTAADVPVATATK